MNARSMLCAMCALAGFASVVNAQPVAQMTVNGQVYSLPVAYAEGTDRIMLQAATITGSGFVLEVRDGWLDPDPSISWGLAVQNVTGAPLNFVFVFSTPIILGPGPTTVFGSIVGGLTDNTGNGVSIAPFGGPSIMTNEVDAPVTNMGVDVGPAMVVPAGGVGALYNYGAFSAGPQPGPPGPWATLTSRVQFTLSGNGDIAVLTGYASIDPIPTPGAAALLALGGTLAARRRRTA
ncbi:MAG: hypothetical protein ACREJO_10420 [Phycisphaerales bacterium]